jgi:glutathione S-transferase
MTAAFTLYGSPHSQFTYKVALMLRLSGQRFSFRYVSFQKGMQKTAEFRALSRWGQVPVLTHGDRALCQSNAILEYLAETLGAFDARDPETRQRVREWLCWDADRFAPAIYGCYSVMLGKRNLLPRSFDPVLVEYYRHGAEAALDALDANLADREFLAAPTPTIADLGCYGEAAFAQLCDLEMSRWPNVATWAARILDLPGSKLPFDLLPMADAEVAP